MADPAGRFFLGRHEERLALIDREPHGFSPLAVDFSAMDVRPFGPSLSRRQPIARAIGTHSRTVADATAGLGHDAFLIACLGFHVTAIERMPEVAALLEDGVARALNDERLAAACRNRIRLVTGDARALIASLAPVPDVVYLDPMFPDKRRASALPPKAMQILRDFCGNDPDARELFDVAHRVARARVVVKRPDHAPPLVPDPTVSYAGRLVRYDVYYTSASGRP